MPDARIAIVGGGLSGLYAARLLQQRGIDDFVVLEARDILGGRILSHAPGSGTQGDAALDRFDLGPTWFWPEFQPQLDDLVNELALERFAQHEVGDAVVERSAQEAPVRMRGYVNLPASMRIVGGMGAVIDSLRRGLGAARILSGHTVRAMRCVGQRVEVDAEHGSGEVTTWSVAHVLLAMPPRLAVTSLTFSPPLPSSVAHRWRATDTWMAPHAKYVAVYDTPFWREHGLSGEGRSARGPLVEIHDASMPGGKGALFGFLGVPVRVRSGVSDEVLRAHCRAQLVRLFGPQAEMPSSDALKDWASTPRRRALPSTARNGRGVSRGSPANGRLNSPATWRVPSRLPASAYPAGWHCSRQEAQHERDIPCNASESARPA